jgi:diaminopimelate decarboxylase
VTGLPPRIHPLARSFLAREDLVAGLLARYGSPLHVVFPEIFAANVAAFRQVLADSGVSYQICYAHKANQARAFVRAALEAGTSIDVASQGELASALRAGFPPSRMEATGPKGRAFLATLSAAGVTINVDNEWELSEIIRLARSRSRDRDGERLPVLVRLSGFGASPGRAPRRVSRFGVPAGCFPALIARLCDAQDVVDFRGLSFHLDSSEIGEKIQAVEECLALLEQCWAAGLAPRVLDIGGGFRQAFSADPAAFEAYTQALKRGLAGRGQPLTWDGNMLGYRYENGEIRGIPVFHKYGNATPGSSFLRELLGSPLPGQGGRTAAQVLRETMTELWVEPGKALADHAGLTLASVEFATPAHGGAFLVSLDISRDKICPADQEVMLDPVVLYRSGLRCADARPVGVFFAGNLCLERDMVYSHLTFLDRLPGPGDIVAFVNTAGYQMDLSASGALMQHQPAKAVVRGGGAGFTAHTDTADPGEEASSCSTATLPS